MDKQDKGEQNEAGFYCQVCDCVVKDSLNYLDHCNGKRHLRNLGISVKTFVDSTYEEVKEMLEFKKRERDERLLGYSLNDTNEVDEERYRRLKREKKKRQKARKAGGYFGDVSQARDQVKEDSDDEGEEDEEPADDEDEEDAMAKLMGFSNFSSSKK